MIEKVFIWVMTFPFKQIAQGLRGMSEASDGGNVAAWIIYIAIGMLPLMWLVVKLFKKSINMEDWLLPVISGLIYYVLYVNINPALFYVQLHGAKLYEMQLANAGAIVYSAVLVYMVLKLVRWICTVNKTMLGRCLSIFTIVSCLILLLGNLREIQEIVMGFSSTFSEDAELWVKLVITFLAIADAVIPEVTYILVLLCVGKVVKEYINNGMSEDLLKYVQRLEKAAAVAVAACVLVNIGYNILQLVLCSYILATSIIVYLPVIQLISLIGVVIVSKLVLESKKIKEENELFV